MKKPAHFWNTILTLLGLATAFIGEWQLYLIAYWVGPYDGRFWVSMFTSWIGFAVIAYSLWYWEKFADEKINTAVAFFGFLIMFVGSIEYDVVVAPKVALVDYLFYVPIGIKNGLPSFSWDATVLRWVDAYVIFFLVKWIGFAISLISLWFWED